jgi:D-alanyl-lipoteichoic acid acyltransferase DltB (MBOAT superfamily)
MFLLLQSLCFQIQDKELKDHESKVGIISLILSAFNFAIYIYISLTPWSDILLEKLITDQVVKNVSVF